MTTPEQHHHADIDRGLRHDQLVLRRRGFLGALGATGLVAALASCSPNNESLADGEIPSETEGPFPGDGSNGQNVLDDDGVVRRDVRPSLGGSDPQPGILTRLKMTVTNLTNNTPMAGAAVYIWQCNAIGEYSMYMPGVENATFLRGVQECDSSGTAEFDTIFPGCYEGRWPHIHFEVYSSVADAIAQDGDNPIVKTSQLAFPTATCDEVYQDAGVYAGAATNFAELTLETDGPFGEDSAANQMVEMSGDPTAGYTASISFGVVGG